MALAVVSQDPAGFITAAYCSAVSAEPVTLLDFENHGNHDTIELLTTTLPDGTSLPSQVHTSNAINLSAFDHVILHCHANSLEALLEAYGAEFVGKRVLLIPGNVAGAVRLRQWFRDKMLKMPLVGELPGIAVFGEVRSGRVSIRHAKENLRCGGLSESSGTDLVHSFKRWLPGLVPSVHTVTSLANLNHVIHPPFMLTSLARIERSDIFHFYREGISAAGLRIVAGIDSERRAISSSACGSDESVEQIFRGYYRNQGMAGDDLKELLFSFGPFSKSLSPSSSNHSYVIEDVPWGLAPLETIAQSYAIPTPTISGLISIFEVAMGMDFRSPASNAVSEFIEDFCL